MVAEQIEKCIPETGYYMRLEGGGAIWLMRGTNLMQYVSTPDPDDPTLVRLLVSLIARGHLVYLNKKRRFLFGCVFSTN